MPDYLYIVGLVIVTVVVLGLIVVLQKLQKRKEEFWDKDKNKKS